MKMEENLKDIVTRGRHSKVSINQTLKSYFTSLSWKKLYERLRDNSPIILIVIRKPSGVVENVLVKQVLPSVEFKEEDLKSDFEKNYEDKVLMDELKASSPPERIEPYVVPLKTSVFPKTSLEDDSDVGYPPALKEIKATPETSELPPVEPGDENVELKVGDKLIVKDLGKEIEAEILHILEEEEKIVVRLKDGRVVSKESSDIVSFA